MKDNRFYIYIWIREDYNTIFYVGKGCDFRATCKQGRNRYFLNIVENIPTRMEKLYDNLTEKEAFELEISTIHNLVYEQGYSIDIEGFEKIKGRHLVNKTWGGEGSSGRKLTEQEKKHLSEIKTGIANHKVSEAMKEYYKNGEIKGELKKTKEAIKNATKMGLTLEQISNIVNLPINEIVVIQNEISNNQD